MFLKGFIILFVLKIAVNARGISPPKNASYSAMHVMEEEWKAFKLEYGKQYTDAEEEKKRFKIFADNKAFIAEHNLLYEQGLVSYRVEMNPFGDTDLKDFEIIYMNNKKTEYNYNTTAVSYKGLDVRTEIYVPKSVNLPNYINWVEKGAVTDVKLQGGCRSCWAFSAVAALEGQHFMKTGELVDLSEQNLIDCSTDYGNLGCYGGVANQAFAYVTKNGGIEATDTYSYKGQHGTCRYMKKNAASSAAGYVIINPIETHLQWAVSEIGPIAATISAAGKGFQFYKDGVYYGDGDCSEAANHQVAIVGYSWQANGGAYWLVKNSWGTNWGIDGYIKMPRYRDNYCGIASQASYPIV